MSGCISEPLHKNCCIFNEGLCFDCVGAFTNEQEYYNDIIVGHDITAIILIIISIYNIFLCYRSCTSHKKISSSNPNEHHNGHIGNITTRSNKTNKPQKYKPVINDENDDERDINIAMTQLHIQTSQQSEPDHAQQEEDKQREQEEDEQDGEYQDQEDKLYIPWMRINNAAFAFLTALFGLARGYFELGKPLAIAGASHNLCEWAFLCFILYKNKKERANGFFICLVWILLIILLVIMIPSFPSYLLIEQISGIAMDVLLPIIWFIMYLQNKNNSTPPFNYIFIIAFIAHLIHLLFTILPLVILNFIQNQNEIASRFLEFCIYISAPITHILYTKFTSMHEKYIDLPSWKYNKNINDIDNNLILNYPKFKFTSHPTIKIGFWYIIAIIVGSLPTFIIPLGIRHAYGGYCHHNNNDDIVTGYGLNSSLCNNYSSLFGDNAVIGTSIANIYEGMSPAFEAYINDKHLVETARKYNGNVLYEISKNLVEDNSYLVIEAWDNLSVAYKWMNSPKVDEVFNDYTYQMMVDGGLEINGYIPLNTYCDTDKVEGDEVDDEMGVGAIRHVFKSWNGCRDLWKDMNNFTNCEWLYHRYGCDHIDVIDKQEGKRIFVMGDGTEYHNTVFYANKREINENLIYYNYSLYIEELNRYPTIKLIYDADNYGKDECIGIFGFETDINIISVDGLYQHFIIGNIPYLQSKYEATSPEALGITDNLVSRKLLKIDDGLEFIKTIQSFQTNATTYSMYHDVAPYLYSKDGQIIFNNLIFNGFYEIQQLYNGSLGASLSVYHSFLMDPIVEEYINSNITTITIISNLYQESKFDEGCDYSYPMMISAQLLTNQYPIKIKKLVYNTPKYSTIEQVNVLTNCQYLSIKERNNLTTNKDFQDLLYEMWNGFKIINGSFGELWEPYLYHNCSVLFDNTKYIGIEDVIQFHDDLSQQIFGGFRFYVIALIGNDGFITVHLRGSVISYDLAINYNYNLRMSIEYRVNENDDILSIIYHIDTNQLEEIKQKFNIL